MTGFRLQIGQNTRQTSECERVSSTLKAKALQATAPEAHANTRIHTIDGRGSKAVGSNKTHSAGLLPAGFGLARRRTVAPPPTSPHPTYPTESACASGAGVATPTERPPKCGERADATARAWLTQAVPLPSPSHDPSVRFSVRHACTQIPALRSPSELASCRERRGRGSAPNSMPPRVWREPFGRRGACVARS